ncbi:MAG: chemotaxis protein CheX [Alphaproteobacteria bacterium]|nr:chemotaxis protein CheX [Alphaproteobacteria bacterium SS10]
MTTTQTEFMKEVSDVIVENVCLTVKTLFEVDLRSEEIFGIDKVCEADFICSVALSNGDDTAVVRFGFDYVLMERLVAKVFSEEVAADKTVLQDAGSEVANIVSGRVKEFLNSQGHNLKADIPNTVEGPVTCHDKNTNIDIIFYDAEDHLAVDVNLGSMASTS